MIDQVVSKNPNLYFIEGIYNEHFLLLMGHPNKEIKVRRELLYVLRWSHDQNCSIKEAYEHVEKQCGKIENSEQLNKQIDWLSKEGVIYLV